ncbi:MAG: large subunit ribosomal protein L18 [Rickettsiales bacterium]|jgi:large subunit ribosomal protein L18
MTFLQGKELRKNRSRTKIKVRNKSNRSIVAVRRTNKNIYVYLKSLDGGVIESFSSKLISDSDRKKLSGLELASLVGGKFAEKCKKNIQLKDQKFIFEKGAYKYFGRVKNIAESCREAGILL